MLLLLHFLHGLLQNLVDVFLKHISLISESASAAADAATFMEKISGRQKEIKIPGSLFALGVGSGWIGLLYSVHHFMCSMMLSPNSEHLISVAPSIKRAKS